jgi:MFS transporter, DHA1 family, staphyloferrin A biosynthesis exporter
VAIRDEARARLLAARLRWPTSLASLRHRNYRLLWAGTAMTQTGQWAQQVATGWLVLDMTGSGFYLGLAGFLRSIPQLFFSIPGGILADRMDRRKLLGTCQAISAVLTLVLAVLVASGRAEVWQVLVLTFVIGSAMSLVFPVRQTLVSNAVPRADLANAVALNSAGLNVTRTVGPAAAGALIVSVGVPICFFLQAIGLFFSYWTSIAMRFPPRETSPSRASPTADLVEGWRYIRATPTVSGLLLTAMIPTALGMPYMALLPMFARDLEIGAGGLGLLMTVMGIGSIVGSIAFTAAGDFSRKGRVMLLCAGAFGGTLICLALSGTLALALASLLGAGFTSAVYQATNQTLLQSIVPDGLRGRVISAYNLTWGMMPLGTLPLGWLADYTGAPFAVGVAGSLCLLFACLAAARLPSMRAL